MYFLQSAEHWLIISMKNLKIGEYSYKDLIAADNRIRRRFKKNKNKLRFKKKDKILIAGTINYINFINNLGTKKIFALDKIKKPNYLKLKKFSNVKFLNSNLSKISFKKNSFSFIFCNGILSHLDYWEKTLKEFYRILKPGGKLWLNVFGDSVFRRMPVNINKKISDKDVKKIKQILTIEKWNIQKINYIVNMFFWKKRILFKKKDLELKLKKIGFNEINFCKRGINIDLSEQVFKNKKLKKLFNYGDLRYLISK